MADRGATAYAYRGWADVERVASEHFGVHMFRPGQRELIEAVLSGRDTFGIGCAAGALRVGGATATLGARAGRDCAQGAERAPTKRGVDHGDGFG